MSIGEVRVAVSGPFLALVSESFLETSNAWEKRQNARND